MAWVSIGTASTHAYTAGSQTSMVHTLGANAISSGNFAVIVFTQQNPSSLDSVDPGAVTTVNDAAGNVWLKAKEWQIGGSAVQQGAVCSVWYTNATAALSSATGTITATLSGFTSFDLGASEGWIFSVNGPVSIVGSTQNIVNLSTVLGSLDINAGTTGPYLRVRAIASRSSLPTAMTGSGGWTSLGVANAASGLGMGARGEFIVTASSTAASAPTLNINTRHASVYVLFSEPVGTAVGSAQGDAAASGVLSAAGDFAGTAQGDATASGILTATALFDGTAQGDAAASGQATATAVGAGAAQGDAAADAEGASGAGVTSADGLASGDADASAEGASLFSGDGAAVGDADAAAIGDGAFPADGLASGDADATAEGAAISTGASQGFAQGDSEASAVSPGDIVGEAIGDAEADAVSAATALSVGAAQGDAAAQATAFGDAPMAGTATGDSDANAIAGGSVGLATGDAAAAAFSNILVASAGLAEGDAEALAIAEGGASGTAIGDSIASAVGFSFIAPQQRGIITHSVTQISAAKARSSLRGTGTVISRVF